MNDSDLVTVGHAYGMADTALATAMLRSAGLPVFAQSQRALSVAWHWTHAFGGIALQVPASDAEDALDILDGFDGTPSHWRRWRLLAFAVAVIVTIGLPPPPFGYHAAAGRPSSRRSVPVTEAV